jgi:hypothetical protein
MALAMHAPQGHSPSTVPLWPVLTRATAVVAGSMLNDDKYLAVRDELCNHLGPNSTTIKDNDVIAVNLFNDFAKKLLNKPIKKWKLDISRYVGTTCRRILASCRAP